jgi:hypothetical protein
LSALAIDVRHSARQSIRISDHDNTLNTIQGLVVQLSECLLQYSGTLRISKQEILLARTVLQTILDEVKEILNARGYVLVEISWVHHSLIGRIGAVDKKIGDDILKHQ